MDQLSREDCESAVRSILGRSEFKLLNYDVQAASSAAIGFMGTHFRITASVIINGSEGKVLRMFAKRPPVTTTHRSYVALCGFFENEARVYTTYAPSLKSVLPAGCRLPLSDCFFARGGSSEAGTNDVIVLEDLHIKGYRMAEKRKTMDLPHCMVVIDALARLHGASILLLQGDGKSSLQHSNWKEEFESIKEAAFIGDTSHPSCMWCRSSAETLATAVSIIWPDRFGSDEKRKVVFERSWQAWIDIFRFVRYSSKYLNVLCHGDTWANNIMVRYGGDAVETPEDVVLVDYQLHRYAPPILDILFFLHTTTRRELRDRHLDDLLKHYRESLSRVITKELADSLLTLDELKESWKEMWVFGRCFATSLLSLVLISDEVMNEKEEDEQDLVGEPDFIQSMIKDRGALVARYFEKDSHFKERMTEVYQEFLESIGLWKDE